MLADEYERKDKSVGGFPLTYTHDLHGLGSRDGAALEKLTELKHTEREKAKIAFHRRLWPLRSCLN